MRERLLATLGAGRRQRQWGERTPRRGASLPYAPRVDEEIEAENGATGRPPLPRWGKFARDYFIFTFGLYPLLVILDDVTSGSLDDSGPWWIVRGFVAVPGMLSGFVWAYAAFRVPLPWWGRAAQVLCLTFSLVWFVAGLLNQLLDFETRDFIRFGLLAVAAVFGLIWAIATGIENRERSQVHPDG